MKIEWNTTGAVKSHSHPDAELVYVREGHAVLSVSGKTIVMGKDDFFVVNPYENHSCQMSENSLVAHFIIDVRMLQEKTERQTLLFACDSRKEKNEYTAQKYEELREAIQEVFKCYYRKRAEEKLLLESAYYKVLYFLVRNFAKDISDSENLIRSEHRSDEIDRYLRQYFYKPITLEALADVFYLSPAYLSRYFKKELGTNFHEYLNTIRLEHAVEELTQTEKTIAQVALGVGFPNIAAFNKKFRDVYATTPTEYRKKRMQMLPEKKKTFLPAQVKDAPQIGEEYDARDVSDRMVEQVVFVNAEPQKLRSNWDQIINIGTFAQLSKFNLQDHTVMLHNELHFRYARVWGLYDKELGIVSEKGKGEYNFNVVDLGLDFLLRHGFKPHIELGYKERRVVGSGMVRIFTAEKYAFWKDDEQLGDFIHKLIVHLLNRYGVEELASWRFEVWAEEDYLLLQDDMQDEYIREFLQKFDVIAGAVKNVFPKAVVGGCGYPGSCGEGAFRNLLKMWQEHCRPDFISIAIYPLWRNSNEAWAADVIKGRIVDSDYVNNVLNRLKAVVRQSGLDKCRLYVTEWNLTVVNENYINDSALKAAYAMYNMISSINRVDIMGYWAGADLFAWHNGMERCLSGAVGLLSVHGIKKPVWYAFEFMNSLQRYLYLKTENYAVSGDGNDNWSIVCHNYTQLNYKYYLIEDGSLSVEGIQEVARDTGWKHYTFMCPAPERAVFQITTYSVNSKYCNVLNEWRDMGYPKSLSQEDVKYLKSICVPHMRIVEKQTAEGHISFTTELEPNEIQLIKLTRKFV